MKRFFVVFILQFHIILFAQSFSINEIPKEFTENAYAVVRNDHTTIDVHGVGKIIHSKEYVVTVFDKSGDKFAIAHEFYNPNIKISQLEAVYYDRNGKEIKKFKSKDFQDQSFISDGQMYTDNRVKFLSYTPAQYPYTLHFKSVVNHSDTRIGRWFPIREYNLSVEKSSFTINNHTNLNLLSKELNLSEYGISSQSPTQSVIHYELKNQKAFEKEELTPQSAAIFPNVEFSPVDFVIDGVKGNFSDWNGMGKWYQSLLVNANDFTPSQKSFFQNLVKDAKNDKEKVSILYKYLQNKTRYIGVQLGIGGLKPFPASYVETKSYGDCKALTNYMQSMLDAVGIKSYYTVVYGGSRIDFHTDFASIAQGNHVILYVPLQEEDLWLETTNQKSAFNFLGSFTDNRNALLVTPEGGKIIRTRHYPAEKNLLKIKGSAEITPDGKFAGDLEMNYTGLQYDWIYQINYENSKEQKRILQGVFENLPNLIIKNYNFENDWNDALFTIRTNLESVQYAKTFGSNITFPVLPVGHSSTNLKKDNSRKFPFEIRYGYIDEIEFDIQLPTNYRTQDLPEPILFMSEFGTYQLTLTLNENILHVKRKLHINEGQFSKEKFNDYVEFRRKISSFDNTKILLEKI